MNYADWYTDRLTIRRVMPVREGYLTRHRREEIANEIPCRIYRSGAHAPRTPPTAAYTESVDKLSCANSVDVRPGDELLVRRGGGLGQAQQTVRAIAGDPVHYYEPFGAVLPGLAHQELALLQMEYFDAEAETEGEGNGTG